VPIRLASDTAIFENKKLSYRLETGRQQSASIALTGLEKNLGFLRNFFRFLGF